MVEPLQVPLNVDELSRWIGNPVLMLEKPALDLLRRCAWMQSFDRSVYSNVLAVNSQSPVMTFTDLADHRFVECLPGRHYRIRSRYRENLLATWREDDGKTAARGELPPALVDLTKRLVDYYGKRRNHNELLRHLAVSSPQRAVALFQRLFKRADENFDLARCHEIVQVLEERSATLASLYARLDPHLREAAQEKRRRLESRWLWAQEYYWTATYIERKSTRYQLDRLIRGKKGWLLHLHARGGSGKTMFLRAVIARRCVPRDIPCARIDFDHHPYIVSLEQEPWRIAYALAEQLNVQLRGEPFNGYLIEYAQSIKEGSGTTGEISARSQLSAEQQEDRIRQVADILGSVQKDPVLVLFDTIENLRERGSNLGPLADLVRSLHERCKSLRVIFSGRYPLVEDETENEQAAPLVNLLLREGVELRLTGFTAEEARSYLKMKRRIPDESLQAVILEKSFSDPKQQEAGYNPFKLALLADAVRAGMTKGEIEKYSEVDVIYLIERVVKRLVDPQLQWLLRYGVIPRWLSYDFVKDVLAAHISPRLQGDRTLDDKIDDNIPEEEKQYVFLEQGADAEFDPGNAWRELTSYASASSWIAPANEPKDALEFHPDVREPMRRILRERPEDQTIYRSLNLAAAEFFKNQSQPEPGEVRSPLRREYLRQAVYHWFEAEDSEAVTKWRMLLEEAENDPAAQAELAREALTVVKLPPADMQVLAGYSLARAYLLHPSVMGWIDPKFLDDWLTQAEQLNPVSAPLVPVSRLALLRARLEFQRGAVEDALRACQKALALPVDTALEIELQLLRADALEALEKPEAIEAFQAALLAAERSDPHQRMAIWPRFGQALVDWERYEEADAVWEALRQAAQSEGNPWAAASAVTARMRALTDMGLEGQAAELGETAEKEFQKIFRTSLVRELTSICIRAEIELARGRPENVQSELDKARKAAGDDASDAWKHAARELEARAAAARLDAETALRQFGWLIDKVYAPGTPRALWAALECARISITQSGNLREAARYLAVVEKYGQGPAWEVRRRLLEIQLMAAGGAKAQAAEEAAQLAARADLPNLPGLRARVMLENLIQSQPANRPLQKVIRAAEQVKPAERRLVILADLRRIITPAGKKSRQLGDLLKLLPEAKARGLDPGRAAVRIASIYHWAGMISEAEKSLRAVETNRKNPPPLAVLREINLIRDLIGWTGKDQSSLVLPTIGDPVWVRAPELAMFMYLEQAERIFKSWNQHPQKELFAFENSVSWRPSRLPEKMEKARDLLQTASNLSTKAPPPLWRARKGRLLAQIAWDSDRQQEARKALDDEAVLATLEGLGRDRELAAVLGDLAKSHERRGSWPSAQAERQQQAEIFLRLGETENWLAAQIEVANAMLQRAMPGPALDLLRDSLLPAAKSVSGQLQEARIIGLISQALLQFGRLDEARETNQQQAELYDQIGLHLDAAKSRYNLADIIRKQGDLNEALRILVEDVNPAYEHESDYKLDYELLDAIEDLVVTGASHPGVERIRHRRYRIYREEGIMPWWLDEPFYETYQIKDVRQRVAELWKLLDRVSVDYMVTPLRQFFFYEMMMGQIQELQLDPIDTQTATSLEQLAISVKKLIGFTAEEHSDATPLEELPHRDLQPAENLLPEPLPYDLEQQPQRIEQIFITVQGEQKQGWRVFIHFGDYGEQIYQTHLDPSAMDLIAPRLDQVVSYSFLRQFASSWWKISEDLANWFLPPEVQERLSRRETPVNICWEMMGSPLAYLPMESIRRREEPLPFVLLENSRYFYRKISFQPPAAIPSRGADVLILTQEQEFAPFEISSFHRQIPIARIWADAAPENKVREMPQGQVGRLAEIMASENPQIVYIQAGFVEQENRALIQCGPIPRMGSVGAEWDARELAYYLRSGKGAPLVVLDPPPPGALTDKMRQLCLRNAFAGDLAEREAAAGIICTGLGDEEEQEWTVRELACGLRDGASIGELARRIQRRALDTGPNDWKNSSLGGYSNYEEDLNHIMPFIGTALFTADPERVLVMRKEG